MGKEKEGTSQKGTRKKGGGSVECSFVPSFTKLGKKKLLLLCCGYVSFVHLFDNVPFIKSEFVASHKKRKRLLNFFNIWRGGGGGGREFG